MKQRARYRFPLKRSLPSKPQFENFGRMNQVLVHELSGLSQALDNRRETANGVASLASADGAPEKQWGAELAGGPPHPRPTTRTPSPLWSASR